MPRACALAMSGFACWSQKSLRQIGWPILSRHSSPTVARFLHFALLSHLCIHTPYFIHPGRYTLPTRCLSWGPPRLPKGRQLLAQDWAVLSQALTLLGGSGLSARIGKLTSLDRVATVTRDALHGAHEEKLETFGQNKFDGRTSNALASFRSAVAEPSVIR